MSGVPKWPGDRIGTGGLSGVPKWPGDRIGTGGACLVYQSGQEIGLVQLFPKRRGRLRE